MKMTAQYRPYRNEDGMEAEQVTWGDQEVGDVEIYQRTTEDIRVVSNRNLVIGAIGIAMIGALLGLLVGYFAHSEHSQCVPSLAVALHSIQEANPYVRKKISQMIRTDEIEKFIKDYSLESHTAGSSIDRHFAKNIKTEWLKHGIDSADIIEYDVLLSYPDKERLNTIRIVDNTNIVMSLSAVRKQHLNPPFSAYSLPGNVSGNLVYVNYGQTSDFQHLLSLGIDLHGKIFIARQWKLPADEIAWNAQQIGAGGLILYPDPIDYNPPNLRSEPYPKTWWLPGNVARTDSVLWNGVGDPLTPGYPAKRGISRASLHSAGLPELIVQPLSYSDAYKLMQSMDGHDVPQEWQGGFNFTYKIGPMFKNPSWKINMQVYNQYVNKTIYNVIGTIKGKTEPDRYVIIGGHRDAWAYGAVDSSGGTAALLELTRIYGRLLKEGWRPRRTIMFCSWGAEEHNLIGSTEWLEENQKLLHERAVAYINSDVLVAGNASIRVLASPLLYDAVFNATKEVSNPNEKQRMDGIKSVYDVWLQTFPDKRNLSNLLYPGHSHKFSDEEHDELLRKNINNRSNLMDHYIRSAMQIVRPKIREMDMRGNYAPFLLKAGIPAVDISYVHDSTMSSSSYPLHHTEYDNFDFLKNFIDPNFKYHACVTKILGELIRDLADSLFLPFNLFDYAQVLQDFYVNLRKHLGADASRHGINLNYLESAIKNFSDAAFKFHANQETVDLSDPMTVRRINDQLLLLERAFLDPNGLPRNAFKKHIIMSPSESYLSSTSMFPGLVDEFSNLQLQPEDSDSSEIMKVHFSVLVFTIQSAARVIRDV